MVQTNRGPFGAAKILAIGLFFLTLAVGIFVEQSDRAPGVPIAAVPVQESERAEKPIPPEAPPSRKTGRPLTYQPRRPMDSSSLDKALIHLRWKIDATLQEIGENWQSVGTRMLEELDTALPPPGKCDSQRLLILLSKANILNMQGNAKLAYDLLEKTRTWVDSNEDLSELGLYTVIYLQGVTALRLGETENCVMCRGECSCIIPIAPAAVHTNPTGSRLAVRHFTEYLERFSDDLDVQWLLNIAHMTLGEYPQKVNSRYLISLDHFANSEFDIGRFREIGHKLGVDRLNMYGGAVMEDLDSDGRLDLAVSTSDPAGPMAFYRNKGDGTFEDRTKEAGLNQQLGGNFLVQTDYNNDGRIDLFVSRGGWYILPMPQTLLRNDGGGRFTDVTVQAGFVTPLNSPASRWADYDNDGWLDVFIVAEKQPNRLYHNRGDGTFEDVSAKSGIQQPGNLYCKGADWLDYDNDDYPDLFLNNFMGNARLYHNNRNGTFDDVTQAMGIDGPHTGFSCWAWDYDNDGWLDLFATSYDFTVSDVVKGMLGQSHSPSANRLFHNVNGKRFENQTKQAGLDLVFAAMGSNFGDLDNDGFLDFYLGTGAPDLAALVPNRMFKNIGGQRFAEISGSSGTAHLQKGHGISCADWDNDGDIDIFIETGGAVPGDRYHNILFQNPGQGNHWLTLKLVGKKTSRSAMGARIKAITAGDHPLTVQRHISSGSSFGANPLQQTLGLGKADRVALLEIHWPTSGTTQVFHDIAANQAIEVTEFAPGYRKLDWKPIPTPK